MFFVITAIALVVLASALIYLVEFGRVSRRDSIYYPAANAGARRARRVAGMYTRGTEDPLPPARERTPVG